MTHPGTALITGASSGIGAATARRLAAAGHDLLLTARRAERLRALAEELGGDHGVKVHTTPLDLDRPHEVPAAVSELVHAAPSPLRTAVLAAGHGRGAGPVREADAAHWESQVLVNLLAPMLMVRALLPVLDRSGGHLVVIGSVFGSMAAPGYSAYAATKHGLRGFLRSLAGEERPPGGCRTTLLSPGSTNTEFASVLAGADAPIVHAVTDWPCHPLLPDDIARTIEWVLAQPPHVHLPEITIDPTDARYQGS